ncbi:MAG: UDP-N-acetylmuramoyl-tripeptide--D-alanyl-D-alanine ligase, partial [Erysipelotrichaceae bacterium]|nr:UDP-N-acetylmuramoyl-tripeptide--D-alanyl-D-alanine ligase [Erysipelotrichaceae bacterium]
MYRVLTTAVFTALALVYGKNALHMFQQNRYEFYRYTKWLFNRKNLRFSPVLFYVLAMALLSIVFKGYYHIVTVLAVTVVFTLYAIDRERKKEYIKDLVLTMRVKRQIVFFTALFLIILSFLLIIFKDRIGIVGIIVVYLPYLLIYPMALLTLPLENYIKKSYENEARKILSGMDHMIKIGITGSFGK